MPLVRPSALLSYDTLVAVTNSSITSDPDPIVFFRINNQTESNSGRMSMVDHLTVKNHQMQAYSQPLLLDYIDNQNHSYIIKGLGLESGSEYKFNNWVGELDFNTWEYDPTPSKLPTAPKNFPQSGFSATVIPKRPIEGRDTIIYIFGGYIKIEGEFKLTNNLLSYNFNSKEWKEIPVELDNIPNLAYHTAISFDNRYLVILGGISSNSTYQPLNKLLVFDTKENKWLNLNTGGNAQCSQKPIVGHSAIEYKGKIIVYGGIDSVNSSSQAYSDFCMLHPYSNWEWKEDKLLDSQGNRYTIGNAWHTTLIINNQMVVLYGTNQNPQSPIMTIDLNNNQIMEGIFFKGSFNLNDMQQEQKSNIGLIVGIWTLVAILIFFILGFYYFVLRKRLFKRLGNNSNGGDNKNTRSLSEIFRKVTNNLGEGYEYGNKNDMAIWSDDLRTMGSFMTLKNPDFKSNEEKEANKDDEKYQEFKTIERLSKYFLEGDTINEDLLKHDEPKFIEIEIGYNIKEETISSNAINIDQIVTNDNTFVNGTESGRFGEQVSKLGSIGAQDTMIN